MAKNGTFKNDEFGELLICFNLTKKTDVGTTGIDYETIARLLCIDVLSVKRYARGMYNFGIRNQQMLKQAVISDSELVKNIDLKMMIGIAYIDQL